MAMNICTCNNCSVTFKIAEHFLLWLTSQAEVIELDPAAGVDSDEDVPYNYVRSFLMLR